MGKLTYEECRRLKVEENKKRLEQLNLLGLSQSLRNNLTPKSSPMKKTKPRTTEKQMVPVRRSARVATIPAPTYAEDKLLPSFAMPRRNYGYSRRDLSNRVYASDETRAYALEKAEELVSQLGDTHPVMIKSMVPSHVTGGFWLGLPVDFCRKHLPNKDETITLVDEEGNESPTVYLGGKRGLSGGWRGFAMEHELVDGDALVFQLIKYCVLKVYIIRGSDSKGAED